MKRRQLETMFEDQMMEMGTLEDDESLHDCPDDCEDIQGECMMNKESVHWMIDCRNPGPPPPLRLLSTDESRRAMIKQDGKMSIWPHPLPASAQRPYLLTHDLRGLIASLQSILVLAEEHFGEEWGK